MAHSMQSWGDKHVVLDDLDLLALSWLMFSELREHVEDYPALQRHGALLNESRLSYTPGAIDLRLNDIESRFGGRDQFKRLLSAVERRLEQFGETVPGRTLNSEWPVSGVTFRDYRASLLLEAVKKLRRVVCVEV